MKNDLIKSIGLELADIRRSKGLLIIDVSKKTKLNKDTICKYENGNSSIKVYILDILLDFYGVNVAIFFTNVYSRMQNNKNKEETKKDIKPTDQSRT